MRIDVVFDPQNPKTSTENWQLLLLSFDGVILFNCHLIMIMMITTIPLLDTSVKWFLSSYYNLRNDKKKLYTIKVSKSIKVTNLKIAPELGS